MSDTLYNTEILRLAANIPYAERLADPQGTAEKRSPICGSRVTVDVALDADGRVAEVGMLVRACALGQASSALLAQHAVGQSADELAAARDALTAWLAGRANCPTGRGSTCSRRRCAQRTASLDPAGVRGGGGSGCAAGAQAAGRGLRWSTPPNPR